MPTYAETPELYGFAVEEATTGRSHCKYNQCKKSIGEGELRIAKITPNPFSGDGGDTMRTYYHIPCYFASAAKARSTTFVLTSAKDLDGYGNLSKADKAKVDKFLAKGDPRNVEDAEDENSEEEEKKSTPRRKKSASKKKSESRKRSSSRKKSKSQKGKPEESWSGGERSFEADSVSGGKFWAVEVSGPEMIVRFGKIGAKGTKQTTKFDSHEEAVKTANKLIRAKTERGGYVETG